MQLAQNRFCCRRRICSISQSRVIHRSSGHIANSPLFMTRFISSVTIIHRRVCPWQRQPLKPPLASVPMQMSYTSHARGIFTGDTSITTVLWLNWTLPAELCQIIRSYCLLPVQSRGARVTGKNPPEHLSALLSLIHAILACCRTSKETMQLLDAMLNNKCG